MQFRVPQFIDIEDKIFGPFTFFQFAYLVGGAGIIFVLYKILPIWISIFLILPVAALTVFLVFIKINGKPFVYYLQAGFTYIISSKLYLWKQRLIKKTTTGDEQDVNTTSSVSNIPILSESKLKDLSWSLDVQDKNKSNIDEPEIKSRNSVI